GERVVVGGVMEHIEKAGIHSGDAACALPPYSLGEDQVRALRTQTKALAAALGVVGLINVQFAVRNEGIYVVDVNPRASRPVPFGSGSILPASGKVFVTVKNRDKRVVMTLARRLVDMGFTLVATTGTARVLERHGITSELVAKVAEGYRPNAIDLMKRGEIAL